MFVRVPIFEARKGTGERLKDREWRYKEGGPDRRQAGTDLSGYNQR